MKEKLLEKLKSAIKNPLRLSIKMFCLVWFFLIVQVILKLTFNYWQPYVIPTEQLENLGNYIDNHRWLQATLNGVFYVINAIIMILCGIRKWWFKNKKETIIVFSLCVLSFIYSIIFNESTFNTLFITIVLPIIINKKSWLWIILTFIISNIFMILSFSLEGLVNSNNESFVIHTFMQFDYYIMLLLNYILFNLLRIKKEGK